MSVKLLVKDYYDVNKSALSKEDTNISYQNDPLWRWNVSCNGSDECRQQ